MRKNGSIKLKITGGVSREVFGLFASLNLMGYDDENNELGMTPIRKKIRKLLQKRNWPQKYPQLNRILKENHPHHLLSILFSSPNHKKSLMPSLETNLKRFLNEPLVQKHWGEFKDHQIKENKKILPVFKKQVLGLIKFINPSSVEIKNLIIITNSLDAYWRGYSVKLGENGYIVVGPGAEKNDGELLRHEFLHLLVPGLKILLPSSDFAKNKERAKIGYCGKKVINQERIVRSLDLLYQKEILKKDVSKAIKKEQKEFGGIEEIMTIITKKLKRSGQR